MKKVLALVTILLLLPLSNIFAEQCRADANCDMKVDLSDLVIMKQDFNKIGCDPCMCNPNSECPTGMVECDNSCVDPMTDEGYCGSCTTSCASGEICVTGVCETCAPPYPAPVPKTGQTTAVSMGDDGWYESGVTWPIPRFTDNENGTVTDNLTGLMWTKDANLPGNSTWQDALNYITGMNDASHANYGYTDWRLPNVKELYSLIDCEEYGPSLPEGNPFINLVSGWYWSSTQDQATPNVYAKSVNTTEGYIWHNPKSNSQGVWPVRGGQ